MVCNAVVLVNENINNKAGAFKGIQAQLETDLKNLANNGIKDNNKTLASISYMQTSTGIYDYILLLEAKNTELLMKAVNAIRSLPNVERTQTHIGLIFYP